VFSRIQSGINRTIFRRDTAITKVPRKKLEIKLKELSKKLEKQINELQTLIDESMLSESKEKLLKQIISNYSIFEETQLDKANLSRIETITENLLHPTDFSVLLLNQIEYIYQEIILFKENLRAD
jgi:hypothetical protein